MTTLDLKAKKKYYNLCDPSKPVKDTDPWFVNIDAGKADTPGLGVRTGWT